MAAVFFLFLGLWICTALAAPQRHTLDYYMHNQELANYYNQPQHKQDAENSNSDAAPARLENLDNPDSEVEVLPGAQPQQPAQQYPVIPNLPGIIPGQRAYTFYIPVAGSTPGSIQGYQAVYVVGAAPNGNAPNYVQGGFQNGILINPSGQGVVAPFIGYPRQVLQGANPGYLVPGQSPIGLASPYNLGYQNLAFGYQPALQGSLNQLNAVNNNSPSQMHPTKLVSLTHSQEHASDEKRLENSERSQVSSEARESSQQSAPQRNARPLPATARV